MRSPALSSITTSPTRGMRPSTSLTSPPTVVASYSSPISNWIVEEVSELIDSEASRHDPGPVGLLLRIFDGAILFMLVPNVADDLLEQVFNGDQSGNAAILIDDDTHVLFFALHLAQQFVSPLGFGYKCCRTLHARYRPSARLFVSDLQQIVRERNAGNVIDGIAEHGHAGVVIFLKHGQEVLQRGGVADDKHTRAAGS